MLHCPEIVGGNASQLARSERTLGLDSRCIVIELNNFRYNVDQVLIPLGASRLRKELARWKLFWMALFCDVVHYNSGQSIMPSKLSLAGTAVKQLPWIIRPLYFFYVYCFELLDVRVLKAIGKAIVVTYQGDDARQGDYCRKHCAISIANDVGEEYYNSWTDQMKRCRIEKFQRYADRIYALNPDLLRVLPQHARFLPYANVDLNEWREVRSSNVMPVLLHAPTNREAKGTKYILDAVESLKRQGIQFEFFLVEGVSHREAKEIYRKADLLVDQLLSGWYGGLALELMALGKPVISYIRDEDLTFIPSDMRAELPVINATSSSIEDVLRHWLTVGPDKLAEHGRISRQYVEKWHDPLKIAAELKQEYQAILAGAHTSPIDPAQKAV